MVRFAFCSLTFPVVLRGCAAAGVIAGLLAAGGCNREPAASPISAATGDLVDVASLCERIDAVLAHARDGRRLNTTDHAAWQVVHGILAFGDAFPVDHEGTTSPALDYLLTGGRLTAVQRSRVGRLLH